MKSKAVVLLAGAVCTAATPLYAANIFSSKRGFGDSGAYYGDLQAANAGWYYDWGSTPTNVGNYNANFYPMFWNAPSNTTVSNALALNPKYILGFNEPERTDQANMTVDQAISAWTSISSLTNSYNSAHGTNIQLVSPAVEDSSAGQSWLSSFMSQASASGLKVDAVAFHWYDDDTTNGSQAASDFENAVQRYHNQYNKPVLITEFADHDWGGTLGTANMIAANTTMLNIVVPWMESQNYVLGYSVYSWFNDTTLYTSNNGVLTPTPLSYSYIGAVSPGVTTDIGGQDLGEHVADLTGGTLTMTSAGTVRYINALANSSSITGSVNWGLTAATNWVRIQPSATLNKSGTNTVTFSAFPVWNDGTLQVSGGVLSLNSPVTGTGSLYISSDGGSTGSTGRFELNGNINVPHPITFAQRNDPGNSDGIRNVSGNNTLSGPMTITVGGSQARVRSDAGLLTLAGPITTDATSSRNFYLQGNGNGIVSGTISNNPSNANGTINLYKEGTGTWTLEAANSYTGNTTISAGTLKLDQVASTTVANTAIANYTFDNVSGSTVLNSGTGGTGMNGSLVSGATIVPGGRFGNALSLAGNGYLNVSSFVTSLNQASNWTVSAWVKTATAGSTLLTKSGNGSWTTGNTIFYLGDGSGAGAGGMPSAVRYAGGFYQTSTAAPSVTDNNWHLVTYVDNGGNYAIYVDGLAASLSDGNSSFGNADAGSTLRIGATTDTVASDGTVNFNGLLDNVQIYGQALSAPQISALYAGSIAGALPAGTNVSIAPGATLDINNTVQHITGLSGSAGSTLLLGSGQLTVNPTTSSTFAGTISGAGGSIVKQGLSTLTLAGVNSYTGGTAVSGGTLIVGNAQALGTGGLFIHGGAAVKLQANLGTAVVLPSLTLDGATGNWSGALDIGNNKLILQDAATHATSLANLQNQVATLNITNSTLAPNFALAVMDNAVLNKSIFGNQNVNASSILVGPELLGDANADGTIDITDLNTVLNNFGTASPAWTSGNFDGQSTIDLTDLAYVFNNFGMNNLNAAADAAAFAAAPEPASMALLAIGGPLLLHRRRRSRRV